MKSIYTKSELAKINRNNSFEYKLARNIATKYGEVYAVAWNLEDSEGNNVAVGSQFRIFSKDEGNELKSFIKFYNEAKIKISFAKCFENLPCETWI